MEISAKMLQVEELPVDEKYYREAMNEFLKFGLSVNQIKIFFFLSKFGPNVAIEISRKLRIIRTEVYQILTSLQNKGMVLASFQHPIEFSALSLNKAILVLVNAESDRLNALKKSEIALKKIWDKIPSMTNNTEQTVEQFQILRGKNQINSKIINMISKTKKEFLILGCEKDFHKFYHADFLDILEKHSIDYKLLISTKNKELSIFNNIHNSRVKILPSTVQDNLCFLISDNEEVLFYLKNTSDSKIEDTAIWTNSESIVYSKSLLLTTLWPKSKVICQ
ncbi:MAG: Transcriptional regulator TrmB [Nitrosopumilales archaeon]|nr:MAG: Transcriptional regulator TrmB [Nitrosopumilales archaeon]